MAYETPLHCTQLSPKRALLHKATSGFCEDEINNNFSQTFNNFTTGLKRRYEGESFENNSILLEERATSKKSLERNNSSGFGRRKMMIKNRKSILEKSKNHVEIV